MISIAATYDDVFLILRTYSHCLESLNNGNLGELSKKFIRYATTIELTLNGEPIGFSVFYHNDHSTKIAYLSRIAVLPQYTGMGYGTELLQNVMKISKESGMERIRLEVQKNNEPAKRLYTKNGFYDSEESKPGYWFMERLL